MSPSEKIYLGVLIAVALERLVELVISKRNAAYIKERGGQEWGAGHYPVMVVLHTALLPVCFLEAHFMNRPWDPTLAYAMGGLIVATMALRYWAITSLGHHWNTRVIVLPGADVVRKGPYRFIRHPNYLAVIVELAAIPLFHSAYWSAIGFGLANLLLLRHRIRVEERALASVCEGASELEKKSRFIPR